jgi:uncharacterized membrane protein
VAAETRSSRRSPSRLDQPREVGRGVPLPQYDAETFGRISDRLARFLGTWRFIGYMTAFLIVWFLLNTISPWQPDPYPFRFLTLLLSIQASYAAPLILLAQNRQADRDRVQYEQDRSLSERIVADTEYLAREIAALRVAQGEVATRDFIRAELQRLLEELPARPDGSSGRRGEHEPSGD